jgi:hypothetical protein
MSSHHLIPFLTVPSEEVHAVIESMHCSYGASKVGIDCDRFDDWASPIDISVQIRGSVPVKAWYERLGFTAPTRVRIALLARCPNALFISEIGGRDLDLSGVAGDIDFAFGGAISGADICGFLVFELVLIRLDDFETDEPVLHSVAAGDILGRFEKRFELEGEGSQFPTDVVRFGEDPNFREFRNAPWVLMTGGELDAQFTSTHWRLYLNADHPWCRAFEALRLADPAVVAHLRRDTVVALAAAVIEHGQALDEEGEEGSLRWVLSRFKREQCEKLFGSTDPEALREACVDSMKLSWVVSHFAGMGAANE